MALTVPTLLILIAVVLTVVSFIHDRYPLVNVAVLLLGLALLVR